MNSKPETTANIDIRLKKISQLFNSLDPSPFYSRDLDNDAEEFITSWAAELQWTGQLNINIHLPTEELHEAEKMELPAIVSQYFGYRAGYHERQLRELFRTGRRHLAIGLTALIICLSLSQLSKSLIPIETIARVIEESFIIVGWVANWKPIEIFLYDWWPVNRRIRLYRRLETAGVVLCEDRTRSI